MPRPTSILRFFLETISLRFILKTLLFSSLFFFLALIFINLPNFISIGRSDFEFLSKLKIFWALFTGSFFSISGIDQIILVIISILFGINLALVIEKYKFVRKMPNLRITLGSGLISLAATGCASCGLSVMSLVGLGSALAILPFGGVELYVVAIIILSASFIYNLHSLYQACKIK